MSLNKIMGGLLLAACISIPSYSQTKPAESTSKLKKVLHYTKCGGWLHVDGQKDLTDVLNVLSKKKGFTVVHSGDVAVLNLENLKTYSAIVWDNNVDGAASVPDVAARQAVLDYVAQGGGWLLVHGAGDHRQSWEALKNVMGTQFTTHGDQGAGDIHYDGEAKAHKELKYMVQDLPPSARITKDEWYAFMNTVRGLPGVTVVATVGPSDEKVLLPYRDGSTGDKRTYIWAKEMGTGRSLYTAFGHGGNQLYAQADSFGTKSVYENLRYVAGDYKNGCTDANATNFNPAARVNDGTCTGGGTGLQNMDQTRSGLEISYNGVKTTLVFPHTGRFSVDLRNAQGKVVWKESYTDGSQASIGASVHPGVYYLTARNGKNLAQQRIVLF
ncbi:MAG: ThuA domain-containing protein [Fibrobacterota bacterium]|nr:ThuA domain-containing protein [Fibrobacterota bacterium]